LTAAHERGIIHRDLKPGNVMFTHDRRVKVLDFGLAKLFQEAGAAAGGLSMAPTRPAEGVAVGTVPYMSPEQLRAADVDARTDLFSFGVLVYELATGQRPFDGASASDTISAILRDTPPPLSSRRAGLPPGLDRVVERCLRKEPRDRYATAREVLIELRGLRETSGA